MKRTRGPLALTVAGAILLLSLLIPGAPVSIKVVGFVLLVAGLSQLRLPRGSAGRLRSRFERIVGVLDPGAAEPQAQPASLDELLRAVPEGTSAPRRGDVHQP